MDKGPLRAVFAHGTRRRRRRYTLLGDLTIFLKREKRYTKPRGKIFGSI